MRVLITGLPLFSKRLAEDLQAFDPENSYLFYDTYYSRKDLLKFIWKLRRTDIVVSLNGVTDRSKTLDMVLKRKKKLVLQWMGTDALHAMERYQNGTMVRDYVDYAANWLDSSWLMKEVSSIGVKPQFQHCKYLIKDIKPVEQYDGISVATYIAQNRQEFYGMEWVIRIAEAFPAIQFSVFGVSETTYAIPSNIILKGWRTPEEVLEAMRNTPIFLRMTDHDGFSVSVIEATALGAEVLTRLETEWTHLVDEKNVLEVFESAVNQVKERGLKPNMENSMSVLKEFDKTTVLTNYVNELKKL